MDVRGDSAAGRRLAGGISAFSFILVESHSGKRTIIHEPGVQRNRALEIPQGDAGRILSGAGYLHLDGFWMDTAVGLATQAREMGIPITLDIGQNQRDPKIEILLGLADYVIPSLPFVRRFTNSDRVQQAAEALLGYGARAVIQTLGDQGAYVHYNAAAALERLARFEEAAEHVERAIEAGYPESDLRPAGARMLNAAAVRRIEAREWEAAKALYRRSLELVPANPAAVAGLDRIERLGH